MPELQTLFLSLRVGLCAAIVTLVPAIIVAWILVRTRLPGRSLINAVVHSPLVLPPVAIGYLLLLLLGVKGPLGHWLNDAFGIRLVFTTAGAVIASAVMAFPLMVRAIKLSLEAVDHQLEFVARSLGASRFDAFFSVTLPLMLPGILAGFLMAFAASLGEFGATITFASNIEGQTRTLPLAIYTAIQSPNGDAMALRLVMLSMVLAIIALIASEFAERRTRARISGQ